MNYENYFVNGSSPVNFCEPDLYYMNLGEFYNTITSFFILLAGIYGIYKLTKIDKNYVKKNLYINEITDSTLKIYKNYSFNLYSLLFELNTSFFFMIGMFNRSKALKQCVFKPPLKSLVGSFPVA